MDKEYLIKKWLNEDLTDSEKQAFNELDDATVNQYVIDSAKYFKADPSQKIADFDNLKAQYKASKKTTKKLTWFNPFIKIASIVFVLLALYLTFIYNNNIVVKTLASQKTTIQLPDNSQVELNALSSIEYNDRNWENKRTLILNGEAYFKVAKGNSFQVKTTTGLVTVVGTKFNVKQRKNYFEVKCFEGEVNVVSDTIVRQLSAGDVYLILDGKFSNGKTLAGSPKWTQNISEFNAIPIGEVIAELERQYKIEVVSKNIDVTRLFTGIFPHDNLENALIAITQPMNMTYEINTSNLVVIHGN